jgi:hypothetical protein
MISPEVVAQTIAEVLVTNKVTIGIKDSSVISEDTDAKPLRPPYAAVFIDFEDEANQEAADTSQINVPVETKILCSSGENRTAALSFQEAFQIANKVITTLKGSLTTDDGEVVLMLRKRPFTIIRNSAEQCIVQANLYYTIDAIGV